MNLALQPEVFARTGTCVEDDGLGSRGGEDTITDGCPDSSVLSVDQASNRGSAVEAKAARERCKQGHLRLRLRRRRKMTWFDVRFLLMCAREENLLLKRWGGED